MTRLGWWLLAGFAAVIAIFVLLLRQGGGPVSTTTTLSVVSADAGATLAIPVAGVAADALTDSWGQERGGGSRDHRAIDIMAPQGTPVLAATAGTVEKLFDSKDGGRTVYIRRDDPAWQDYYAHLDSYAPDLAEGMKVERGQVIGAVGSTGSASEAAPHLHY
ncbi:M23 family metallopeptidase, partial [Sphingomonas sp.]|uniref:M23 family metallopeptidase n=1 Tax=Sphingomonas sp. TaxID=28214 RepID=UPI003B3BBFD2